MPKQFKDAEKFLKQGLKSGISSKHQESLAKFKRALTVFRQINDRAKEALTLNCIGEVYQTIGQERKALEFHQQALEIGEEISDLELQGSAVRNMGFVHYFLGLYDEAETLFQKAIKLHEQINDEWSVAGEIGNLGLIHFAREEYDLAIENYQQCLRILEKFDAKGDQSCTWHDMGDAYRVKGNLYYENITKFRDILDFGFRKLKDG